MPHWGWILALAVAFGFLVALRRENELFCLRVRSGDVEVVRGRIPPRLLADIRDVVRGAPGKIRLRGVVEDRRLVLRSSASLTDAVAQRLRNVCAQWPVTRVRNW